MSSHSLVIPLRVPDLVKADFGFRLYVDGTRRAGGEAAIAITQINDAGDYLISGLPDLSRGHWGTLTWEYPTGAGSSHVWPQQVGTPPSVIIPLRETGYVAGNFSLKLYRNGVEQSTSLTVAELVTGGGDYRVTGWGTAAEGDQWLLTWQLAGIAFSYPWVGAVAAVTALPLKPFQRRASRMISRLVRYYGEGMTVVVRRRHSLVDDSDGAPESLTLVGDHAEGATTLTLEADRLDGALPPGLRLTLGGVQYEVAGFAEVRAFGNRLTSVPLAAPLAEAFTDGDDVLVEGQRDFTFAAMAGSRRAEFSADTQPIGGETLALAAEGAPTTPRPEDLVLVDGNPEDVVAVRAIRPGGVAAGWILTPRGRAA